MAESSTAPPTQRPYQTKLVLLGEAAVGKSSVVLRFVSNDFQENKEPTIGAAFLTQKCRLEDRVIKFEIWDTAGQERFHSLAPMYYRNAQASAVIYDVTKASSFEKAKSWVKELQRQANPNIVIALVGNKIDLLSSSSSTSKSTTQDQQEGGDEEDEDDDGATTTGAAESSSSLRAVPKEEATAYAKELGLLFFETSAKTGEGVTEVFTEVAKRIKIEAQNKDLASSAGAANAGSRAGGNNANRVDINRGGNGDGRNNKEACAC